MNDGEWMFWAAIGVVLFVCLYAAAVGGDAPAEAPPSSLDL